MLSATIGKKSASASTKHASPSAPGAAPAVYVAPPAQATAAQCYGMNDEYLRFGCPYVSTHPTYQHPGCVAIRSRMSAGGCSVPGLSGLGAVSQTAEAFKNWLGGYPDTTKVARGDSDGVGISTRGDRPGVVFITEKLADLMEIRNSTVISPDPTVWYGTVGQLRKNYATTTPPIRSSYPSSGAIKEAERQRWMIGGGLAAVAALGYVLWRRRAQ